MTTRNDTLSAITDHADDTLSAMRSDMAAWRAIAGTDAVWQALDNARRALLALRIVLDDEPDDVEPCMTSADGE